MNKKKLGAIVGVVGVAGTFAATQFIDINRTSADYVTKNLLNRNEEAKELQEEAVESPVSYTEEKVYDQAQKIEYVFKTPEVEEVESESKVEAEKENSLVAQEEAPPEEVLNKDENQLVEKVKLPEIQEHAKLEDKNEEKTPEKKEEIAQEIAKEVPSEETPVEEVEESVEIADAYEVESTPFVGIVNTGTLYVRAKGDQTAEITGYYGFGHVVRGELLNGWVKVEDASYVKSDYVDPVTEEEALIQEEYQRNLEEEERKRAEEEREAAERVANEAAATEENHEQELPSEETPADIVETPEEIEVPEMDENLQSLWTSVSLNVRAEANSSSDILDILPAGHEVRGSFQGDWFRLEGGRGYLAASYLTEEKPVITFAGYTQYESNIRREANDQSDIITTLPINTYLEGVVEGDWISFDYEGQTAYINRGLLGYHKVEVQKEAGSGYISTPAIYRDGPGVDYNKLGGLDVNEYIEGYWVGEWLKFTRDGQTAYVWGGLLQADKVVIEEVEVPVEEAPLEVDEEYTPDEESAQAIASDTGQAIANAAENQIGLPYVFGSSGPGSFDCSGLTMRLYADLAGVYLPHSAMAQSGYGVYVSLDNLMPGDLLFFTTDGTGEVSHVGVYIGGGTMVHASDPSTGVCYDNIYSSYYSSTFVTARRIIQ